MKMIVCGGRDYDPGMADEDILVALIEYFEPDIVITGGAVGVDKWAATVARRQGMTTSTHLPDYDKHIPRVAPLRRDEDMVVRAKPDGVVVAFTGGSGTAYTVRMAHKHEVAIVDLRRVRGVSGE